MSSNVATSGSRASVQTRLSSDDPSVPYWTSVTESWNQFWFAPAKPNTLSVIRIATGSMLFYMHIIWASDLLAFLGPNAWVQASLSQQLHRGDFTWSYLWYIESPAVLWAHQVAMLVIALMVTLGLATRVVTPIAWFMNLMYCHRLIGHLFGLDQVVMMLLMYLAIAPCGDAYSIDAWLRRRKSDTRGRSRDLSTATNVATRLIQIHLCIIYLFGGLSKLRGEMWWDGSAMWYALVNWEYQSVDAVWLGRYPILLGLLTHITIFWESFYCATVWPRATRCWTLLLAVLVHAGIAFGLGMITFGWMMIVANMAFIDPRTTEHWINRCLPRSMRSTS